MSKVIVIEIAYTIEYHAERYESVMVIVAILSPLLHTYDLRAGNQITRRIGTLHITHHTSHHTHLSIHPIPPKENKKEGNHSHSLTAQPSKGRKPTGNVTRIPSPHLSKQKSTEARDTTPTGV